MGWIAAIIVGFIVGLVARFLMPGKQSMGFIFTTLLGVVGATVGKWLGQLVGIYQAGDAAGFVASVVGAMVVLFVWGMISKKS